MWEAGDETRQLGRGLEDHSKEFAFYLKLGVVQSNLCFKESPGCCVGNGLKGDRSGSRRDKLGGLGGDLA